MSEVVAGIRIPDNQLACDLIAANPLSGRGPLGVPLRRGRPQVLPPLVPLGDTLATPSHDREGADAQPHAGDRHTPGMLDERRVARTPGPALRHEPTPRPIRQVDRQTSVCAAGRELPGRSRRDGQATGDQCPDHEHAPAPQRWHALSEQHHRSPRSHHGHAMRLGAFLRQTARGTVHEATTLFTR